MLRTLIARGDKVYLKDLVLHIEPKSGKPVPNEWLDANGQEICKEIRSVAYRLGVDPYNVTTQQLAEFINSGQNIAQWQTDEEWLSEYNKADKNN